MNFSIARVLDIDRNWKKDEDDIAQVLKIHEKVVVSVKSGRRVNSMEVQLVN